MTPEEYEVVSSNKKIGTLHKGIAISEGDNIILAGKLWKILQIDNKRNKVYVEKTGGAKPPGFLGDRRIKKSVSQERINTCETEGYRSITISTFRKLLNSALNFHLMHNWSNKPK